MIKFRPKFSLLIIVFLVACSDTEYDFSTPENAHRSVIRGLEHQNYDELYVAMDSVSKVFLNEYIDQTRKALAVIDSQYPTSQQHAARHDLTLSAGDHELTMDDFQSARTDTHRFVLISRTLFQTQGGPLQAWRSLAATVRHVRYLTEREAVIQTLSGESIVFTKERDGQWHTGQPFRTVFHQLALMSRQNLTNTLQNIEVFK